MSPLTAGRLVRTVDRLSQRLELVEEEAWIRDRQWRFLYANPAFARYLDTSPRHIEGRLDIEFFSAAESLGFRRDDQSCAELSRAMYFFEKTTADAVPHETLKFPLLTRAGDVAAVVGIACPMRQQFPDARPPSWLRQTKREVSARFSAPLTVGRLSGRAGVHPDHLGRTFKRHYGFGLRDFVRRLRVQWCSWAILEDPARHLGEIAAAAGFSDQSHLTREFARLRGTTPGRFRERWRAASAGRAGLSTFRLSCLEASSPPPRWSRPRGSLDREPAHRPTP